MVAPDTVRRHLDLLSKYVEELDHLREGGEASYGDIDDHLVFEALDEGLGDFRAFASRIAVLVQ